MASDHSQQTNRRPAWTFVIVAAALFMVVLDNLVVTTALPSIRADLGATIQSLEWTVNAYTLSYAVLLLTGAALGDRFGRRRLMAIGLTIFTLASAAAVRDFATEFTLAFDRELIPNYALAALNLIYQPEWTHFFATGAAEQESTIGAALRAMVQMRPGILFGSEARYLRRL